MKKLVLFLLIFIINIPIISAQEFEISSDYVILYNQNDGSILYEKQASQKVPIASLTKIMTALVAIEQNPNLDEKVTISSNALSGLTGYSKAGFKVGEEVTIKDLLYGVLLPSGADAVKALAIHTSGMVDNFVDLMNDKAKKLNMNNTSFENPIGMDDENNYSTAKDMATLLAYALENETFKEIFTTRHYVVPSTGLELTSTLIGYAGNNLDISEIDGAKSGYTPDAGYCLASIAEINDVKYLLITLSGDTQNKSSAVKDSVTIYNYYSENYSYQTVLEKGQKIKEIPIKLGKEDNYTIKIKDDVSLYLENDLAKDIKIEYEGVDSLNKDIKKKDKLGEVILLLDDEKLYTYEVFLEEEISYHQPVLYAIAGFILIIIILLIRKKIRRIIRRRKRRKALKKSS